MSQLPDAGTDPQTGQSVSLFVIYRIRSPIKPIRTQAARGYKNLKMMQNEIFYHENSFELPTWIKFRGSIGSFFSRFGIHFQIQPVMMVPENRLGWRDTTTKTFWWGTMKQKLRFTDLNWVYAVCLSRLEFCAKVHTLHLGSSAFQGLFWRDLNSPSALGCFGVVRMAFLWEPTIISLLPFGDIIRSLIQVTFNKTLKNKVLVPVKPVFTGLWYRVISSVTLVGGQGSNGDQGWAYMYINRAPKCNRENDCQYRSRWTYLETNGMKPRHQTAAAWLQESHSAATSALQHTNHKAFFSS